VEEADKHLSAGCGGEQVCFVAFEDCCPFVPEVVALEEYVVDGVSVAAVRTAGVVSRRGAEAGRVTGIESVSGDELESGGLVGSGMGGEHP
jgi:hypothetical protein